MIIYLDVNESSRILGGFFFVGGRFFFFLYVFLLDLVRFCPSKRPAAAKQEINSQPDCFNHGEKHFGKQRQRRRGGGGLGEQEELITTDQQRRPLFSSKNCFVCALQERRKEVL